jgi:hypothetical protein
MEPGVRIDVTGASEAGLSLRRLLLGAGALYMLLVAAGAASVLFVLAMHFPAGAVAAIALAFGIWIWRAFVRPRRAEQNVKAYGLTLTQIRAKLSPLRAASRRFRGWLLLLNVVLAVAWIAGFRRFLGNGESAETIANAGGVMFVVNGMRLWSDKTGFFKTIISYAVIAAVWVLGLAISISIVGTQSPYFYFLFLVFGLGIPLWITSRIRPFTHASLAEMRKRDPRPPVLFIRSFQDEAKTFSGKTDGASFEKILTEILRPYGPFIGIGKPGELRPAGAARVYYPHDGWQNAVLALMDEAGVIAALPGVTPGLDWELNRIAESKRLAKALFVFAAHEREQRFARLRAVLAHTPQGSALAQLDLHFALAAHVDRNGRWVLITSKFASPAEYQAAIDVAIYGLLLDRA